MNARDAKNVPGRKTAVNDAQWIRQLHSYGLLRGSFRPQEQIVALRAYLRHRERLIEYAASHIQHMQKSLMQMNLQLHHVVSDITGATGMKIIRAILEGERRPSILPRRISRCQVQGISGDDHGGADRQLSARARLCASSGCGESGHRDSTQNRGHPLQHASLRHCICRPGVDYYEERYRRRTLDNLRRRAESLGFPPRGGRTGLRLGINPVAIENC